MSGNSIYWFSLILGGGYVLIQFILLLVGGIMHGIDVDSGGGDLDFDADAGDFDFDSGDFDVDTGDFHVESAYDPTLDSPGVHLTHGEAATGTSDLHVGPFSPMTIATFFAGFGGMGLVINGAGMQGVFGIPGAILGGLISLLFGIIVAAVLIFVLNKFFEATSATSGYSVREVIGTAAEVHVPMDTKSMGQITYRAGFATRTSPAVPLESADSFKQGQKVWIAGIKDGVFQVVDLDRALTLRIELEDDEETEQAIDAK